MNSKKLMMLVESIIQSKLGLSFFGNIHMISHVDKQARTTISPHFFNDAIVVMPTFKMVR